MLGEPTQIQAGEHDPSGMTVAAIEFDRKVDHPLASGLIGPVIADGESVSSHCALEERLIRHRGMICGRARAKYPALRVRRREKTVIGILGF